MCIVHYRKQFVSLHSALSADPENNSEPIAILRSLINRIVVTPSAAEKGVILTLEGKLAAILSLGGGKPVPEECMVVVEGQGNRTHFLVSQNTAEIR